MTIQELIDNLQSIEDKSQVIGIPNYDWDCFYTLKKGAISIQDLENFDKGSIQSELNNPSGIKLILA